MKTTSNPGTNYGRHTGANTDKETGIHYGVIPSNDISPDAFGDIAQNGTDTDFEEYRESVKKALSDALSAYFSDMKISGSSRLERAVENAFEGISDDVSDTYEGTGDCTRYLYERGGYKLQVASDGDIFVIKSPYFTYAQFCSPCAPGACYLRSPLDTQPEANKAYCLGADWFEADAPCPYPVYSVETGKLVNQ